MTCASCGSENRVGRKFCVRCGAALGVACPACGAPVEGDGILFVGDRGVLVSGFSGGVTFLSAPNARDFVPAEKKLTRSTGHYKEWILAAKGGKPANCNFEFGALLTEIALLGVIAQRTGKSLTWDADTAEFTNNDAANKLLAMSYRTGWSI